MNSKQQPNRLNTMSWVDWAVLAAAGGTLLLTVLDRDLVFRETIRYSIQGFALAPFFYFAIKFPHNRLFQRLNSPWVVSLGIYSYSIYLIHYVVIRLIVNNVPAVEAKWFILFPTALLLSIAYAAAIDRYVDPYFRQLRRNYRRMGAAELAAS